MPHGLVVSALNTLHEVHDQHAVFDDTFALADSPRREAAPRFMAWALQSTPSMSVKNMLPIIGVGSAAALIGLVASRRSASRDANNSAPRQRPSGISVRRNGADPSRDALDELPAAPHGLPQGFWDATPESTSYADESISTRFMRERDEPSDRDSLTADWLTRATQAPMPRDANDDDYDDPAEIPADSLSMISDASRFAAARADEDASDDDDDADPVSQR